jgi:iron complex outermembrane recepter protein
MLRFSMKWRYAMPILVCLMAFALTVSPMRGQQSGSGSIQGTVVDPRGQAVQGAAVVVRNASEGAERKTTTDGEGKFTVSGLTAGDYSVEISAAGFAAASQRTVTVGSGPAAPISISLAVASVAEEVTVEADDTTTMATQLSPVKALLDAGSARTEITNMYIREFTSPMTDFTEVMQMAPGTFSVSPNGVGLGQSNTSFRGFIDGDFTINYDGIPFNDTNNPTHHSWAFFPAPDIGGVDFDRSPGTASSIGPANYGGTINLLSPTLPADRLYRISESYGSWNSSIVDGEYNTGLFGGANPKANLWFDGHHMGSDGYETFNYQQRTAGAVKFTYKFSDKTFLTIDEDSVILDANNSGNSPTREQLAEYGANYYLDGTQFLSDGATPDAQYYRYYFYHVPTNFGYVGLNKDLGRGWKLDTKAYVYDYSNHEHYNNNTANSTILDPFASNYYGTPTYYQTITTNGKGGIDKMNQYTHVGDILTLSSASKYGVFRTGFWYEYAGTDRYQIEANPLTWVDYVSPATGAIAGIKFHENFWTNSVQPFAEYQLVAIPKWIITLGVKDAYYNMSLKQFADDGHIVGSLNGAPFVSNDAGYNSWLPSFEANYRIKPNWSAYVQYGAGSVIPPSSVFDVNQTTSTSGSAAGVTILPKPQLAQTYQGGSVLKLSRVSLDADYYYIHFQNSYVATPVANSYTYSTTPPSNTMGVEAEGNVAITRSLSVFLNGTVASAKYVSTATTSELWVASAPANTASEGVTYQNRNWDLGFINKRVGPQWNDNTDANGNLLHQAIPIEPFTVSNLFLNYTVRNGSKFDQSKVRLSFNNLFNNNNIAGVTAANTGTAAAPFVANGMDMLTTVPGRSVMATFQFGFSPKER